MSKRLLLILTTLVVALSRLLAIARAPWEWDEYLFLLGMRDFDIARHQPHPPGFPLFIGIGKALQQLGLSDFHALQSIVVFSAVTAFPAMYAMARAFGFEFRIAYASALLFVFFPNVWFFGGSAFSDVPSVVLAIAASALLLRDDRRASFLLGCVALGAAMSFRPQNLLFSAPLLIAIWRRRERWTEVVPGIVLLGAIPAISYACAIEATGSLERYLHAVRAHSDYIRNVDSFHSPVRPALPRVLYYFMFRWQPYLRLGIVMSVVAMLGAGVGWQYRRRATLITVATFAPFFCAAVLMLDRFSVTRFSIAYAPMFAVLMALGLVWLSGRFGERRDIAYSVVVATPLIIWTLWISPGLRHIRRDTPPSVAAVAFVEQRLAPDAPLFVAEAMMPFRAYYLAHRKFWRAIDERALDVRDASAPVGFLLAEGRGVDEPLVSYTWPEQEGALWKVNRGRYFRTFVQELGRRAVFDARWSPAFEDEDVWVRQTNAREADIALPPASGQAVVKVRLECVPATTVTLLFNGIARSHEGCDGFRIHEFTAPAVDRNTLTLRSSSASRLTVTAISFGPK